MLVFGAAWAVRSGKPVVESSCLSAFRADIGSADQGRWRASIAPGVKVPEKAISRGPLGFGQVVGERPEILGHVDHGPVLHDGRQLPPHPLPAFDVRSAFGVQVPKDLPCLFDTAFDRWDVREGHAEAGQSADTQQADRNNAVIGAGMPPELGANG